jgi:hypothetical protein
LAGHPDNGPTMIENRDDDGCVHTFWFQSKPFISYYGPAKGCGSGVRIA